MKKLASLAPEIEDVLAGGDMARRSEMLRKITDLFVAHADALGEAHVAVFDEVILRLSRGLEFRVRVELAERLAEHEKAPRETVRDLAFDEHIAVAGPVIQGSPRLDEADLVVLAEERGQEHLRALSQRATLSSRVTDVLVRRGDAEVSRLVTKNAGAAFSSAGFTGLIEKARVDVMLQRMLQARCDLPQREMALLVEIAREKVRETFRQDQAGDPDRQLIEATIDDVAAQAARDMKSGALMADFGGANAAVARRAWKAPLGEKDIRELLEKDLVDEALVVLASVTGVPAPVVARAYHASHYDPLLFIVRAKKIAWETFEMLLVSKTGRRPSETVLRGAREAFEQITVETAGRILELSVGKNRPVQPPPM
jgi:uncharacterized protein (DUF2336 family)